MVFRRIVTVVQVFAVVLASVTVVLLFTRQPPDSGAVTQAAAPSAGARLFADNCASCHGADGRGASAPQLVGRVVQQYPNVADQVAVVADGKNGMPPFRASLSPEQIATVVDFTRGTEVGPNGSVLPAGAPVDGEQVYADMCAACHGDFLEGTYAPAFKGGLMKQKYPDPAPMIAIIQDGSEGTSMKAYRDKLTPEQLQAVVEYIRSQ